MSEFSRRNVLSAAAAGGALAAAGTQTLAQGQGQPRFGPAAPPLAGKELPSFRFALGAVTPKTWEGGWAKQATVAEFPVSEKLAGVLMSLKPGALRELHWHANAAEWAYVIKGQCRITVTAAGSYRDRRLRSRRRLVLSARPWPFHPGHRPRGLSVSARLRQRLFLRVRHVQHHRLDRAHFARGAGEGVRRNRCDLRKLPQG